MIPLQLATEKQRKTHHVPFLIFLSVSATAAASSSLSFDT